MKLNKKALARLKKCRSYLLFVIDDDGVGYFNDFSKEGITNEDANTLLYSMSKNMVFMFELLRGNNKKQDKEIKPLGGIS